MNVVLPPWLGRVAAVALLLLPLALLYAWVARPVLEGYAEDLQSIAQQQALLQRYREIGGRLPQFQAELAELRRGQSGNSGFLQGTNDVIVAAELQDRLKRLVEAAQGSLQSTQVLAVREEGKFRRVAIRGQMNLTMAGLQRVVYDIEAGPPALFLDNLDLRPHVRTDRPEEAVDSLDIGFDLYGYLATGR
jgi:general secretion pathway protein M